MAFLHLGSKRLPRSPDHLCHLLEALRSLVCLAEPEAGFKSGGGDPGCKPRKDFLARR